MYLLNKNNFAASISLWRRVFITVFVILLPSGINAQEFGASVVPQGGYLLNFYPKIFFTSAYFSDEGKTQNLETVTALFYLEMPVHIQYGLTGSSNIGAILPIGWTYQEVRQEIRRHPIDRLAIRELWLTVQHRWWSFLFFSSSSLRIKIPLSKKKVWEDGLRIGDGQVDIFPLYYVDYYSEELYWYTELTIGYKYRFKNKNRNYKPFDELKFKSLLGYELWENPKIRGYIYADLTRFRNGDFGEDNLKFFEYEGSLQTFGYGVTLKPIPKLELHIETAGDWFGRNRYRGMRWLFGFTIIL